MALAAVQLSRQSIGPASIAGGVSFEDAFLIKPNEASLSENWRHRQGVLEFRDQLRSFLTFAAGSGPNTWDTATGTWNAQTLVWDAFTGGSLPTGPITRLDVANFRSAGIFLMALDLAHIWQWNGSGATMTDITGGSITSGSNTAPWSSDTVLDAFFADNGLNELIFWLGTGNAAKLSTHASYTANTGNPANLIGRYVVGFAGRVFIGFTTESGTLQGQRVRWCSDSDYFDWRPAQRRGAGAVDCSDTGGNLTGLVALAQQLYVLKSDAIVIGRETGDIATPFAFPTSLKVGCISGQSFAAINPQTGIFLGNDNVYRVSGVETDPIGDKIKRDLFARLSQTSARQIVSQVIPNLSAYCLAIPVVGNTEATRVYIYNYMDEVWYIEEYPTKWHSAASILIGAGAQTWDGTAGTWDAQGTTAWDSFQAGTTAPRTVIGTEWAISGADRWRVHSAVRDGDYTDSALVTQAVDARLTSKLFKLSEDNQPGAITVKGVWIFFTDASGGAITVAISVDGSGVQSAAKTFPVNAFRIYVPFEITGTMDKITVQTTGRLDIRAITMLYDLR